MMNAGNLSIKTQAFFARKEHIETKVFFCSSSIMFSTVVSNRFKETRLTPKIFDFFTKTASLDL